MPIYVQSGSYTLGESFVAGGGIYTKEDASALGLWTRFRATPVDESGNSLTVSYDGTPATNNQLIPSEAISRIGELPVAEFLDSGNTNAKVSGTPLMIFNNGSSDTPFTFATWARTSAPWDGTSHYFFGQENVAGGTYSLTWGPESSSGMRLQMKNAAGNSYTAFPSPPVPNPTAGNEWVHYAVTYDGKSSASGVRFYLNGESIGGNATVAAGYVFNDTNSTRPNYIGASHTGIKELDGEMSEFCMWRKALTPSAIKALYHSTAGRYYAKSGIVSLPNRVRLVLEDNQGGAYPNQLRTTGNLGDKGNTPSTFNDTVTQVFKSFDNALYPMVNPERQLEKLNTGHLLPTPNQNSNIETVSVSRPAISTHGTFIDSAGEIQNTPFDESKIFLKDKSNIFYASGTADSDYPGYSSPLRDKIIIKIPVNNTQEKTISRYSGFHMLNDDEGLLPNTFRSTGFYYYNFSRSAWEDIALESSTSMFYTGSTGATGGLSSVSLGSQIVDAKGFFGAISEASRLPKLQQFKMSDHMGVFIDSAADSRTSKPFPYADLTSSLGYHLVGAPTEAGLAPWHPRYHATGSQTVRMSDYITGELAVEKVVLDIPVVVQRMRGGNSGGGQAGERYYDSCRDIDNYTFFLYRQRRPPQHGRDDSAYAMTSSRRELICSGAASFYNSNAFSGRVPDLIRKNGLPHTPSFSHDFNAASSIGGTGDASVTSVFTGSIRVEMKVATSNGQPVGGSRFPLAGPPQQFGSDTARLPPNGTTYHRSVVVQDWWPGGRTNPSASNVTNSALCQQTVAPLIFRNHFTYCAGLKPYAASQVSNIRDAKKDNIGISRINRSARSFVNHEGTPYFEKFDYNNLQIKKGFTSGNPSAGRNGMLGYTSAGQLGQGGINYPIIFGSLPSSVVSAFVMEPGDELILGIDAGISMLPASGTSMSSLISAGVNAGTQLGFYSGTGVGGNLSFGCMSGSFMKILAGQASLTIFGSQMKENEELLGSSNQGLTSAAIHESIGDARVVDQIDTPQRHELSGSYVDRLIFGSALDSRRKVDLSNQVVRDNDYRLNAIQEGAQFRTTRAIVALHSKDRTGIHISSLTDSRARSPDQDMFTGYPPSFTGRDQTRYQFFVGNTSVPGTNDMESDPFFVTPKKAAVITSTNTVSLQRFITLPFVDETYYDSMAPEITDWARRVGSHMKTVPAVRLSHNAKNTAIPIVKIWAGNQEKIGVYPYQGNPSRRYSQKIIAQLVPNSGSDGSITAVASNFTVIPMQDALPGYNASRLIQMTLFNRGFRYTNVNFTTTRNVRGYMYNATGSHGPRYGMISPVPSKPVAVFRRDRFGQFRDMLEQSRDTKFFTNNSGQLGKSSVGDSPIQVLFVDSSDGKTPVDPFTTSCFNCSTESTSSIPYSDLGPSYSPPGAEGDVVTLNGTLLQPDQAGSTRALNVAFTKNT